MAQDLLDRLVSKIEFGPDCWDWTGARSGSGYGQIRVAREQLRQADRVLYELVVGPIPEGLELDHLCLRKVCVNPDHVEPVTHTENMRRVDPAALAVWSRLTHCKWGHPFDAANTYVARGRRYCRACRRRNVSVSARRCRERAQVA